MGVTRRTGGDARGRLTVLLVAGLAGVFAGTRILATVEWVRLPLILLGGAAVAAAAVLQFVRWRRAGGEARGIEAVFAFGYLGCALALAGYLPGTEAGGELLGLDFEGLREELRFRRFFLVASPIVMAASLLPVLAAHWALGRGGSEGALTVDAMRLRETAASTLSLALAGSALVLIGYVAAALNRTADFSYFKTATPGEAVREIVRNMDGTVEAALFFPEVNPVKDELRAYLEELGRATGKVVISEYDRYASPDAAAEFGARADGQLYLRLDGRSEQIALETDLDGARGRLRVLDSHVQQALLQLNRQRRYAYLTKGHGEFNDPASAEEPEDEGPPSLRDWRPGDPLVPDQGPPMGALREMLDFLNYEARDIGLTEGLGDQIPDDAAMLMILGPQRAFLESEMNSVREYLDRGGSLLLAMEPGSSFSVDALRDHLPVAYNPAMTIDDERYVPNTPPSDADRRFIITDGFSAHPSVTTAGRSGADVLLVGPGTFEVVEDAPGVTARPILRTLFTSYPDLDGDFRFDDGTELKERHPVAVAVEGEGEGAMRALVYGDAEIFTDRILTALQINAYMVADGIRWLGAEEAFAGEVQSEEDVPILHTRSENVAWFYAIIFGAPTAVLGAGAYTLYGRRGGRRQGPPGELPGDGPGDAAGAGADPGDEAS